jgi:hypothetical protein
VPVTTCGRARRLTGENRSGCVTGSLERVSFFELPELDPPRPWRPRPPWWGAPEHELGVDVPIRRTIASDDKLWLGLVGVIGYSTGFTLRLAFLRRSGDLADVYQDAISLHLHESRITEKFLRLGVEFADGRRATNLDEFTHLRAGAKDEGDPDIALAARGHGHGPRSGAIRAWVWPLPPSGPLAAVVEWPAVGLAVTRLELPTEPILEASTVSRPLWDDDPEWESVEE